MRAEEARHLELPAARRHGSRRAVHQGGPYEGRRHPELNTDGGPRKTERHLPVRRDGLQRRAHPPRHPPLIETLERLFASDPRLAGYLPPFGEAATGGAAAGGAANRTDAEAQRRNYRELLTVLSETNLRANKDQLLSTGVPVWPRRKSGLRSDDVQVRVRGRIGPVTYLGDTPDWLVRSSAGVGSSGQTGGMSARKAGVQGAVQGTLAPRRAVRAGGRRGGDGEQPQRPGRAGDPYRLAEQR